CGQTGMAEEIWKKGSSNQLRVSPGPAAATGPAAAARPTSSSSRSPGKAGDRTAVGMMGVSLLARRCRNGAKIRQRKRCSLRAERSVVLTGERLMAEVRNPISKDAATGFIAGVVLAAAVAAIWLGFFGSEDISSRIQAAAALIVASGVVFALAIYVGNRREAGGSLARRRSEN